MPVIALALKVNILIKQRFSEWKITKIQQHAAYKIHMLNIKIQKHYKYKNKKCTQYPGAKRKVV